MSAKHPNYKEPFILNGQTFLPVEAHGCRRCAVKGVNDDDDGGPQCHEMPKCSHPDASIQWVHDTPENRADYVKWRMK
jgi:hypothetical protein